VATRPVDFLQADTLAAFVQGAGGDPTRAQCTCSKRIDRVKLLWWDSTGICLLTKRLEGGAFRWPPIGDGVMRLRLGNSPPARRTSGRTPHVKPSGRGRRHEGADRLRCELCLLLRRAPAILRQDDSAADRCCPAARSAVCAP
jgi:transposase